MKTTTVLSGKKRIRIPEKNPPVWTGLKSQIPDKVSQSPGVYLFLYHCLYVCDYSVTVIIQIEKKQMVHIKMFFL